MGKLLGAEFFSSAAEFFFWISRKFLQRVGHTEGKSQGKAMINFFYDGTLEHFLILEEEPLPYARFYFETKKSPSPSFSLFLFFSYLQQHVFGHCSVHGRNFGQFAMHLIFAVFASGSRADTGAAPPRVRPPHSHQRAKPVLRKSSGSPAK
jgi:hypothetical protein